MRILQLGHPDLRVPSTALSNEQIQSAELHALLDKMKGILNGIQSISSENGNALSAPQSGSNVRMILLRLNGEFVPMFNPKIVSHSEQTFEFDEECFSLYDLRASVRRYVEIEVSYQDQLAQHHTKHLSGEAAGLLQHEIDHLDGVLFLDHLTSEQIPTTIGTLLQDNPQRLKQVREMIAYMRGD